MSEKYLVSRQILLIFDLAVVLRDTSISVYERDVRIN
jgi:hypothetical protein